MELLLTPESVANRLDDPMQVIVDATLPPVGVLPKVDTHARYLQAHLPGAVFFDIDAISDATSGLPHTLPTEESFAKSMAALGIRENMTIVVYEQEGIFSAPRALWMLRSMGACNVGMLDGGLAAWKAAGYATEQGSVARAPAMFHATLAPDAVTSFSKLQRVIAAHGQILDARSAGRFAGTAPEPRAGLSSGHMPGAISVPYTELVRDGRMKPQQELRELFDGKGIDRKQPLTTTCGSGVTAAVVSLALEIAGTKDVSLYDGSWAEYAQRPEAVIEKA